MWFLFSVENLLGGILVVYEKWGLWSPVGFFAFRAVFSSMTILIAIQAKKISVHSFSCSLNKALDPIFKLCSH